MLVQGLKVARTTVRLVWLVGTAALMALVVLPAVLPALGHQVFIVRGASMEPAIPLGSVVLVHRLDPQDIQNGEVVTYRSANGTVVTHRVTSIANESGLTFTTKGDASQAADPSPIPAAQIVGYVESSVPVVGYLIIAITSPLGLALAVAILGTLLLVGWSLDQLTRVIGVAPPRPSVRMAPLK
jgi:signal peptidase